MNTNEQLTLMQDKTKSLGKIINTYDRSDLDGFVEWLQIRKSEILYLMGEENNTNEVFKNIGGIKEIDYLVRVLEEPGRIIEFFKKRLIKASGQSEKTLKL